MYEYNHSEQRTTNELSYDAISFHITIIIYCTITIYYGSMMKWIMVRYSWINTCI